MTYRGLYGQSEGNESRSATAVAGDYRTETIRLFGAELERLCNAIKASLDALAEASKLESSPVVTVRQNAAEKAKRKSREMEAERERLVEEGFDREQANSLFNSAYYWAHPTRYNGRPFRGR